MTRVKPGQRKRAYNPKTRTGCLTCKLRRLKCDEGKPECFKCISTGRKCEGYGPVVPQHSILASAAQSRPLNKSPSLALTSSSQDSRSFQFFIENTLDDITRVFPDPLWTRTIPMLSRSDPGICHAVLALAHFHERFRAQRQGLLSQSETSSDDQGLFQYNTAIAKILGSQSEKPPPADIYLISCVIFISIEFLRKNYSAAINLGHQGLKMIRDLHDPIRSTLYTTRCTAAEKDQLLPLLDLFFLRIECQIFTASWMTPAIAYTTQEVGDNPFIRERLSDDPNDSTYARLCRIGLDPEQTLKFNSVEEARAAFERAWYIFLTAMNWGSRPSPHHAVITTKPYMDFLSRFDTALDDLIESQPTGTTIVDNIGLAVLDLRRRLIKCNSRISNDPDRSMDWDTLLPEYTEVIEIAENILGVRQLVSEVSSPGNASLYMPTRTASITSAATASSSTFNPRMSVSTASEASSTDSYFSQSTSRSVTPSFASSPAHFGLVPPPPVLPRGSYSPDRSTLPLLFSVVARCRDPALRRRIIHMLRVSGRQEGFYDGTLIATVGERMIEIEESGRNVTSAAEIPATARIDAVYVRLSDGVGQGGVGPVAEFRRPEQGGVPPPSVSGLSTMVPHDDALATPHYCANIAGQTPTVTWVERIRW